MGLVNLVLVLLVLAVLGGAALVRAFLEPIRQEEKRCIYEWFEYRRARRLRAERAQSATSAAISRGKLVKGACVRCGAPPDQTGANIAGHHLDLEYRPENKLSVAWVCRPCHKKVHQEHYQRRLAQARRHGEPWWLRDENGNIVVRTTARYWLLSGRSRAWWSDWRQALGDAAPDGQRVDWVMSTDAPRRRPRQEDRYARRMMERLGASGWVVSLGEIDSRYVVFASAEDGKRVFEMATSGYAAIAKVAVRLGIELSD